MCFKGSKNKQVVSERVTLLLSVSIDAWLILDQSKHFWSIEPNFRSIKNRIESFLKTVLHMFKLIFFKKFSTFSLSIRLDQGSNPIFCHFPPLFLQSFSLPRPVRHFYPSFCIYLHVSCIKSCNFGIFSDLENFGDFDELSLFFYNWSMGFCWEML